MRSDVRGRMIAIVLLCASALPGLAAAQVEQLTPPAGKSGPVTCSACADWVVPHAPVRLYGNTWWVGSAELGAILITSPAGHVLLDGGLPANAPQIIANLRAAGFRLRDVKVIGNSHAHYDHAGGIAALQRATGARVVALPSSAAAMRRGQVSGDDPQATIHFGYPAVRRVQDIADGDTVRVGPLVVVAHRTAGHTTGGTTWTWRSCEGTRCVDLVYADSQTPVSSDEFRFTGTPALRDFEAGRSVLEGLHCDLLVTPHPGASDLWARVAKRDAGDASALLDATACRQLAARAKAALDTRLAREAGAR